MTVAAGFSTQDEQQGGFLAEPSAEIQRLENT
jgi:hypothetical protein